MKAALSFLSLSAAALSGVQAADAAWSTIPAIEAYGQHFFYTNNGSQYYMKGVAYQQDYDASDPTGNNEYTDPLANASACARDIPYMKDIFTNVIRVYAVDPTKDHDDCMNQLAENDIYVLADLASPDLSIDSNDPAWNAQLYDRYTSVISAFAKYNNVIGFFAGNEVVETANQTSAAAYVKAAVRDMKSYISTQGLRTSLGVGYATADVPSRDDLAHYFACEATGDNSTQIDFWGYNVYSWCGESSYTESGYSTREEFFSDFPVPAFFSEYGCISGISKATARPFTEVAALYGKMNEAFSGGIVYEWFMGANDYGLVSISGDTVSTYPDYTSLSKQLATVSPTITQKASYTPSNTAPTCPTVSGTWSAMPSPLPPAVNAELCSCMMDTLECTVVKNDTKLISQDFSYLYGLDDGKYTEGIASNATTGDFGAYSGCDTEQQIAFAINQYYLAQDSSNQASACDFSGIASTQAAKTPSSCKALVSAAGTAGTGSVAEPTGGTAAGGSVGGTSSSAAGVARLSAGTLGGSFGYDFGPLLFAAYAVAGVVSTISLFVL